PAVGFEWRSRLLEKNSRCAPRPPPSRATHLPHIQQPHRRTPAPPKVSFPQPAHSPLPTRCPPLKPKHEQMSRDLPPLQKPLPTQTPTTVQTKPRANTPEHHAMRHALNRPGPDQPLN